MTKKKKKIDVKTSVQSKNDQIAADIRATLQQRGIKSFNLMGSIGSGKTTLISKLSKRLADKHKILVINGDWTTNWEGDINRIKEETNASINVKAIQINTYGASGCHLTAKDIKKELDKFSLADYSSLFIENVGNLICPSSWDLGCNKRLVMVSVTEGPYMIKKHAAMFNKADVAIINKIELADVMEVDLEELKADVKAVNSNMKVVLTSAKQEKGLEELISVLEL